jgi:hypothetical protein
MKTTTIVKITSMVFLPLCCFGSIFAQNIRLVKIGNYKNMTDFAPNEPSVAMNTLNTNELVIGANAGIYYMSKDGGLTWTEGVLSGTFSADDDPIVIADNHGSFYYFHQVAGMSVIKCQKKNTIDDPWTTGSSTPRNGSNQSNRDNASFDPVYNNLYATWTQFSYLSSENPRDSSFIYFSRSEDLGLTWTPSVRISKKGGNSQGGTGSVHGACNTTGPNGEVYVSWWGLGSNIYFDKSDDQGKTWLADDIQVISAPNPWIFSIPGIMFNITFPVIACDRSNGDYRGMIYIAWANCRNNSNDSDIWLVRSMDGGQHWSVRTRISNGPAFKHQFACHLTIDQVTGYVYVLYYDRRNYSDSNTDVYLAVSKDGGDSFDNMKISDAPFVPVNTAYIGDNVSVCAHNNKVFATWTRQDNAKNSIWGAMIDFTESGIEPPTKTASVLEPNSPNPFSESTIISFQLDRPRKVTLQVTDQSGKMVATLIQSKDLPGGKHTVHFEPNAFNLQPGIYYYSIICDNKPITKQMVFTR